MLPHLSLPSVPRGFLLFQLILMLSLLPAAAQTRDGPPVPQQPPVTSRGGDIPATQRPPSRNEGHGTETNPGRSPQTSTGVGISVDPIEVFNMFRGHDDSPDSLSKNGPHVPKEFDMSKFAVHGLVGPNWPVVLDFILDTAGAVQIDIIADDGHHYRARIPNVARKRGYIILRLPTDFGKKTQAARYEIQSVSSAGATTPAPAVRTFGLGAGERAVGSVAIDQLTFQPAVIHPKAKEVANYGFHTHSAFNGVRVEFIRTTLSNGHVLVEKDQEAKLAPIPEGERAKGTWEGKGGKTGEHMLQIRAWRGLEKGGDWVVAWSPDIVNLQ